VGVSGAMNLPKMDLKPGHINRKAEAVILAGGFGTRLKGIVDDYPKPMALIRDKPFLTYLLEQLYASNCQKVVLAVGFKHETIIDYFGKSYKSIDIEYVIENKPLGTGGAILNALKLISTPVSLILNGDSIFKIDITDFNRKFIETKSLISIALKRMQNFDRYGTVFTKANRVVAFKEKERCIDGLINSGIYMISNDWYKKHSIGDVFSFEKDILEKYVSEDVITAFEYNGYFIDIGIPEDYRRACLEL
jgi:D-glycero-alpha-D-manno-heptose 1-phosphate guanylyltransferase